MRGKWCFDNTRRRGDKAMTKEGRGRGKKETGKELN